jgi:hypothetical protein
MKKKILDLDDLLDQLEHQENLNIEQVLAFTLKDENLIEKLKVKTGLDEDSLWAKIKDKKIKANTVLSIYRSSKFDD